LREHQDTDRHYIGDSLPVPSDVMTQSSGTTSSAGSVAFPARADHQHTQRAVWGLYNSGNKGIPPGSTYINNFAFTGWGRNMFVSQQVLAFPFHGLYLIVYCMKATRDGGGIFQNEMNIAFTYQNGSNSKLVYRTSMFDVPSEFETT